MWSVKKKFNWALGHTNCNPCHISSHPLFDDRQGLLWESQFGHYWFTGDSVPKSLFHKRPKLLEGS